MSADWIYLDYAATTPVDPRVAETMQRHLGADGLFANPSALHLAGRASAAAIQSAAESLAQLVNCDPGRLLWTSGATESNNLAIQGVARSRAHQGKHLVTMPTEHKAVTDVYRALEKDGFEVTWLKPSPGGVLDPASLEAALRSDTQLVSIMYVNNETGAVQDIETLGGLCREHGVAFHVDAAQAIGKLKFDITALEVDLVSMSAHKLYGPKGVGALYVRKRDGLNPDPLLFGGAQQGRLRPGTLPVHLIAGFGHAASLARELMLDDFTHVKALCDRLWRGIQSVPGLLRNGDEASCYPGILNVSVDGLEGESLLLALEPLCVSTGSACNSQSQEPSGVLRAMGVPDSLAESAIRFSFGRTTSEAEVETAAVIYRAAVSKLKDLLPEAPE
ncbi:MAG: aminotransferase class V-fold PLP-dependent enzyme [Pseudomonadota bacterium]